jgi:hypothetical protein|tara:strand:- start:4121 stop:4519 length:399 start_codon:yes stop_codon:yes gene_type:complete
VTVLRIQEKIPKKVLTSRASARSIEEDLSDEVRNANGSVEVDLQGVVGMAPSFFDELLSIIDEGALAAGWSTTEIVVSNPPSELLAKHHLVCKGHGFKVSEDSSGRWIISQAWQRAELTTGAQRAEALVLHR